MPYDAKAKEKAAANKKRRAAEDDAIKARIARWHEEIRIYKRSADDSRKKIERQQEDCPHNDVERWTNNDGDGQFIVERCKVCELQKDGGLSR